MLWSWLKHWNCHQKHMSTEQRSTFLKEMGISEWSLRQTGPAFTPEELPQDSSSNSESQKDQTNLEPRVYWLFYGKTPTGDAELLFKNIVRALGLLPSEWEWRLVSNTSVPDTHLPCVAFAFGQEAAQSLSGEREPLENLRDVVLELAGHDIPLVASFDLTHLLAKPSDKALAWQDLLLARSVLQSL